jgi:hypothetical protein
VVRTCPQCRAVAEPGGRLVQVVQAERGIAVATQRDRRTLDVLLDAWVTEHGTPPYRDGSAALVRTGRIDKRLELGLVRRWSHVLSLGREPLRANGLRYASRRACRRHRGSGDRS